MVLNIADTIKNSSKLQEQSQIVLNIQDKITNSSTRIQICICIIERKEKWRKIKT